MNKLFKVIFCSLLHFLILSGNHVMLPPIHPQGLPFQSKRESRHLASDYQLIISCPDDGRDLYLVQGYTFKKFPSSIEKLILDYYHRISLPPKKSVWQSKYCFCICIVFILLAICGLIGFLSYEIFSGNLKANWNLTPAE